MVDVRIGETISLVRFELPPYRPTLGRLGRLLCSSIRRNERSRSFQLNHIFKRTPVAEKDANVSVTEQERAICQFLLIRLK